MFYKFNYRFDINLFIEEEDFDFNCYPSKNITNMVHKLTQYKKEYIYQNDFYKKYRFHTIDDDIIKKFLPIFYNKFETDFRIWSLKITHIERLLCIYTDNICYPIGYDKYHFLNSIKTATEKTNEINVNIIKFYIYHCLRTFINISQAEKITNNIIPNNIQQASKNKLYQMYNKIITQIEKIVSLWPNKLETIKKKLQTFFDI